MWVGKTVIKKDLTGLRADELGRWEYLMQMGKPWEGTCWGEGGSKSPVGVKFYLRSLFDSHENIKLESPLRFRFRSKWHVDSI